MAKINLDRGLYDWAEIEAKRASELDGKTRTIGLLLAEIYIYKGEFRQAIKILKDLHSKDIDNPQIKKLLEIAQRIPEEQNTESRTVQAESGRIEVTEVARPGDSPIEIVDRSVDLKGVMEEALTVKGVRGSLLVSNEGLVAESRWQLKSDVNECGAVMSEIWKSLSGQTLSKAFGNANNVLIESSDLIFYLVKSHNGVLVFVAGPTTNLGTFRLKIEGLMENLTLTVGGV
jgi:predicted regulator of Ras-like GTPase activity (Roadblock/LC7/MglB family)